MVVLKKEFAGFMDTRRHFLVEPEAAAQVFCGKKTGKKDCALTVEIRTAGLWEDLCLHQKASTHDVERFYLLTLQCKTSLLKIYSRDLPPLKSLIKR